MTDQPPLKPCPFCGHAPEMRQHRASDGRWGGFYVECTACSIAIDEDTSTPTEAAIRWNLRAPVEITDEMVDRLNAVFRFGWETSPDFGSKATRDGIKAVLKELAEPGSVPP